jgi:hypothetical protein
MLSKSPTLKKLLLGICFWRAVIETAFGLDRRAGKRGLWGKRGSLGRIELLKIEPPKGRTRRRTPKSGGVGKLSQISHLK